MITLEAVRPIDRAVYPVSSIAPDNVPTPVIPDRISTVRHLGYHHRSMRVSRSLTMCRRPCVTVHVGASNRISPATAAEQGDPRGAAYASELDLKRVLSRRAPMPQPTNCYSGNGQAYRCRSLSPRRRLCVASPSPHCLRSGGGADTDSGNGEPGGSTPRRAGISPSMWCIPAAAARPPHDGPPASHHAGQTGRRP
jgi:hypothetical protein